MSATYNFIINVLFNDGETYCMSPDIRRTGDFAYLESYLAELRKEYQPGYDYTIVSYYNNNNEYISAAYD